ncbi:hypothetical protein NST36_19290 [Bacillus sp. FSL R5-0293]
MKKTTMILLSGIALLAIVSGSYSFQQASKHETIQVAIKAIT